MAMSLGMGLCLAYTLGLLLSSVAGFLPVGSIAVPGAGIFGLVLLLSWGVTVPRRFKLGFRTADWVCFGIVFLGATLYIAVRSPSVGPQDISHYVERAGAIAPTHIITGRVIDEPSLNRELKSRFRVAVQQLQGLDADHQITFQIPTQGQAYVSAPLLQVTGLHAGQRLKAKGRLYLPTPALNPNGFDFQAYLTQQNTFAGFVAEELRFQSSATWGLWRIRQRIVRAQVQALGSPIGQLVSAMALGREAVDLPTNVRDLFARVGLAHTIAASGFHVSLLLGVVLALMRSRPDHSRAIVGGLVLAGYVILTGGQASVIRAAIMGGATLLGLATGRQVIPSGALLIAVAGMLIWNPMWIWDIGFQLSVMATWGLIVTVPTLTKRLDWMPVTIAGLVAVPLAATLWTLPLTLYHFNVMAGLSVVLNLIATPLVTIISLGGMGSSALALVWPTLGAWIAQGLYFPAQGLWWLAQTSSHWPGSSVAIGQITLWQFVGLYTLLGLGLCPTQLRVAKLKPLLPIAFVGLLWLPIGWRSLTQHQITILAAGGELVWVQQDHGRTRLVNQGDEQTALYTVTPFLTQAGVNRLDHAIVLPNPSGNVAGWQTLLRETPSAHLHHVSDLSALADQDTAFHSLLPGQTVPLPHLTVELLDQDAAILRLTAQQRWLLLPPLDTTQQAALAASDLDWQSEVLVWSGDAIAPTWLTAIHPKVAICYGRTLPASIERLLQQAGIQTYWTQRDGAVTWQNRQGFHSYLETKHRNMRPWG
jgi:competence protein ComEC